MKKLMTMLAAAAMACGLYAADAGFLSGTSFNSWTAGSPVVPAENEGLTWVGISADSSIGPASWVVGDFGNYGLPEQFKTLGNGNALNIKSALDAFATVANTEDAAGANIYVDTLVKFTAYDVDDAAGLGTSNAKLGVWIRENSDGTTNLFVTAGVVDGTTVESAQAYDCGEYTAGEWCRLTIKSLGKIASGYGVYGFVVFVNGEPVTALEKNPISYGTLALTPLAKYYANEKCLFPSIVNQEAFEGVLGFAGQGAIDDLVFTTQAPSFAADQAVASIDWEIAKVEGIYDEEDNLITTRPALIEIPTSGKVAYKAAEGYVDGSIDVTGGAEIKIDNDVVAAAASFAGKGYAELSGAVAAANDSDAEGTLKLYKTANAVQIENTKGTALILDLNGISTKVQLKSNALTINNTGVAATVSTLGSVAGTTLTLNAGKYETMSAVKGTLVIPSDSTAEFFDFTDGYAAIAKAADLNKLALVVNAGYDTTGETFKQTVDIDMTSAGTFPGIGVYNNGLGSAAAFKGVYDGNNQTISNVTIAPAKYQGLFAQVEGGTVKNLTVDTVTFGWVANYATKTQKNSNGEWECVFVEEVGGAMCVSCLVDGTVENVTTKGSFGSFEAPLTASAGGVVNRICAVNAAVNITSCTNEAAMYTAGAKAAGIAIINQKAAKTVTISDCVNKGAINFVDKGLRTVDKTTAETTDKCDTAGGYAGVIAHTIAITINNCSNEGTITVAEKAITDGACIGQIIGHVCAASGFTVTGCKGTTTQVAYGSKENGPITTLDFATVADDVATYVAAPTLGGSFLVTSEKAAYEFTEAGTITFDNSLVSDFAPTADGTKFDLTHVGDVWTCTVKPTTVDFSVKAGEYSSIKGVEINGEVVVGELPVKLNENDTYKVTFEPTAGYAFADGEDGIRSGKAEKDAINVTGPDASLIPVESVTLDFTELTMNITDVSNLVATVAPATVLNNKVDWSVENAEPTGCVTVDANGAVRAVAAGTATVKAASNADATKYATCTVTVKAAGPVYPQDLPDDPAVKAKYDTWATGKDISNPDDPVVMEAFLLNCDLDKVAEEKAKFKIISITPKAEGGWDVKVAGDKGEGDEYGNGFVEIVPYEGIDVENGELFQAKLVLQLSTKGE